MDDQERLVREHISENPLPILSEHFFMESVANPHYTILSMSSIEHIINPHYTILSMSSIEHIIYTHYTNLSIESSYLHPI